MPYFISPHLRVGFLFWAAFLAGRSGLGIDFCSTGTETRHCTLFWRVPNHSSPNQSFIVSTPAVRIPPIRSIISSPYGSVHISLCSSFPAHDVPFVPLRDSCKIFFPERDFKTDFVFVLCHFEFFIYIQFFLHFYFHFFVFSPSYFFQKLDFYLDCSFVVFRGRISVRVWTQQGHSASTMGF